jgi:uncharacterized protein (DUF58 family)
MSFDFARPGSSHLPGTNRSGRRGPGLSFVGYREYQFGDDIRSVDWNVAARQGHPVVKLFEQEHATVLVVVLDGSASMRIPDPAKWDVARELAILSAFIATREGDAVGAMLVTGAVEMECRPGRGLASVNELVRRLVHTTPSGAATDIGGGVERAQRMLRSPGVLVIVSDFCEGRWDASVLRAAQRHTVIALRLVSPRELNLPDVGLVEVRDAESGASRWVDSHAVGVRAAFAANARRRSADIRARLRRAGARSAEIRTGDPIHRQLCGVCRVRAR